MRTGNLSAGAGQLKDATEKLTIAWQTARMAWNDQQAVDLEENCLIPLFDAVGNVMPAIDQMNAAMSTAARACQE